MVLLKGRRRARLRLLHELRPPQGGRAGCGRPGVRLLFPWHPLRAPGAGRGPRASGRRRGVRRLLRRSGPAAVQLGAWASAAVRGRRVRRCTSSVGSATSTTGSTGTRRCRVRSTGAAIRVRPHRVEFWQGRPGPDARPAPLRPRRRVGLGRRPPRALSCPVPSRRPRRDTRRRSGAHNGRRTASLVAAHEEATHGRDPATVSRASSPSRRRSPSPTRRAPRCATAASTSRTWSAGCPFGKVWGLLVDGAYEPGLPPARAVPASRCTPATSGSTCRARSR